MEDTTKAVRPPKTKYTRAELIAICEAAIVPHKDWGNRDSYSSQIGIGKLWALLKAGCKFEILHGMGRQGDLKTDSHTIWVKCWAATFAWFEYGEHEENPDGYDSDHDGPITFYLPTTKRLKEKAGKDWY